MSNEQWQNLANRLVKSTAPVDRSKWGSGRWDDEPDNETGITPSGLIYRLIRGYKGAWCGYVLIPSRYPEELEAKVEHYDIILEMLCGGRWWAFDSNHSWQYAPEDDEDNICRDGYKHYETIFGARAKCYDIANSAVMLLLDKQDSEE